MSEQGDGGSGDSGNTRTGFGRTLFGKTSTALDSRKIKIKSSSGKVYGPFERKAVFGFIVEKKLTGDEKILVEGEADWKEIVSDLDFFDLFQKVQSGQVTQIQPELSEKIATQVKQEKKPTKSVERTIPKTAVMPPGSNPPERNEIITSRPPTRDPSKKISKPNSDLPDNQTKNQKQGPMTKIPISENLPWNIPTNGQMPEKEKQKPRPIVLVSILALVFVGFYLFFQNPSVSLSTPRILGGFKTPTLYGSALKILLEGTEFRVPAFPEKISPSGSDALPPGLTAQVWVKELLALSEDKDPAQRVTTGYWARWAWSLFWLGATIESFDRSLGQLFIENSRAIVKELKKRKIEFPQLAMFEVSEMARLGNWQRALEILGPEKEKETELVSFLREELSWQKFWTDGAKGEIYFSAIYKNYSDSSLDFPSQIRRAFVTRNYEVFQTWVTQFAAENPFDPALWFVTAEMNWRLKPEGAQLSNGLFLTGLATVALIPKSFQWVYWSEYQSFLKTFGRQGFANKVATNFNAVFESDVNSSYEKKSFFDLNDPDFQFGQLGQEVFVKSRKGILDVRDMATLAVVGMTLPEGNDYLNAAAQHLALTRKWKEAERFFTYMTNRKSSDLRGWGGLAWVAAQRYSFDNAIRYHDELVKRSTSAGENQASEIAKYLGVIQSVGREYEEAEKNLNQAIRLNPTDGWAHYFLAEHYERIEKYLPCLKAANLGRVNGVGEVAFRSELLILKCRILARVDIRGALKILSEKALASPNNIELKLAYADALAASEQVSEAIRYIGEQKDLFPRSFELRMKLGDLAVKKKDFTFAIFAYNRALKDNPTNPEASYKIGKIFYDQSNWIESARNFEIAAGYDSDFPEIWLWVARAYQKAGQDTKALEAYQKEIEIRPAVLSTFLEIAEFLLVKNAPQEVPKLFQKFSSDFQDDPRVLTRLAQAYLGMQDYENAQSFAATVLTQNPNIAEAHRVLGFVYENMAYFDKAKFHFNKYLSLIPQAADAAQIRSRISRAPY